MATQPAKWPPFWQMGRPPSRRQILFAQPETPMAQNLLAEAKAHFEAALRAETGFVERLVWFWANHFCVNVDATVMTGAYVREAIRPHILGRFTDLLLAG